jgi:hypothetical protein
MLLSCCFRDRQLKFIQPDLPNLSKTTILRYVKLYNDFLDFFTDSDERSRFFILLTDVLMALDEDIFQSGFQYTLKQKRKKIRHTKIFLKLFLLQKYRGPKNIII